MKSRINDQTTWFLDMVFAFLIYDQPKVVLKKILIKNFETKFQDYLLKQITLKSIRKFEYSERKMSKGQNKKLVG